MKGDLNMSLIFNECDSTFLFSYLIGFIFFSFRLNKLKCIKWTGLVTTC